MGPHMRISWWEKSIAIHLAVVYRNAHQLMRMRGAMETNMAAG
jgi:hypothetical protein